MAPSGDFLPSSSVLKNILRAQRVGSLRIKLCSRSGPLRLRDLVQQLAEGRLVVPVKH